MQPFPRSAKLRRVAPAVVTLLAVTLAGCGASPPDELYRELTEGLGASLARYQDVDVALAEGYVRDPLETCEMPVHRGLPAELGAMGIHYLHPQRLGIGAQETRLDATGTHTDFRAPGVLIYEPGEAGSLTLVGVENVVSAEAWRAAGNEDPPQFEGIPFTHVPADPAQSVSEHYDLHLWLFRENPAGLNAAYNPAVSCDHHVREMPMMPGTPPPPGDHMR